MVATRKLSATPSTLVLDLQFAEGERLVNAVRIGVLLALLIGAVVWRPHLTSELNLVNLGVAFPTLLWALGQHIFIHRPRRRVQGLSLLNSVTDLAAITILLVGYGIFGSADLALKSPMWVTYFVILAARPFTGNWRNALVTAGLAVLAYGGLAWTFLSSNHLPLLTEPLLGTRASGSSILEEAAKCVLIAMTGAVTTYAAFWSERTMHRATNSVLRSEARFRTVFDNAAVGIALLDHEGTIVESNPAFSVLVGYQAAELEGVHPAELTPSDDADAMRRMFSVAETKVGHMPTAEVRWVRKSGEVAWGSLTLSQAAMANEQHTIAMVQDITERKALESELMYQAFHDPLTHLPNRALFRDRVEHALTRLARGGQRVAVMFLDLDNFKGINDTFGHATGDELLQQVAERLLSATRGCDTVARLGGDEFALLVEMIHGSMDERIVADRIRSALKSPIRVGENLEVTVSASIGIAEAMPGCDAEEILRNADVAMYSAKAQGRGFCMQYDPAMHSAVAERVHIESELREALQREQLHVAYQPIMSLSSDEMTGVEALARWSHPSRGIVPPAVFIPVAEESGLIVPLGRWILGAACDQGSAWCRQGKRLTVTVNISLHQLQHGDVATDVADALRDSGMPPELLVLEITESALMKDTQMVLARLRELKALGVRLAIDDFGTGYSSLSHLQQFPIDILKIDRAFTEGVGRDDNATGLAKTIIALGALLHLRTVAEGVETREQLTHLRGLGCELGQGYLYSKPIPAHEIDALLVRKRTSREHETVGSTA